MKKALIVGKRGQHVEYSAGEDRIILTSIGGTVHWQDQAHEQTPIGVLWDGQRWGKWPAALADAPMKEVLALFEMVTGQRFRAVHP